MKIILVKEVWNITSLGILVNLQHSFDGLPCGMILTSISSGKKWLVVKRIIFNHVEEKQKRFDCEDCTYTYLRFLSNENRIKSINNIIELESQKIYQYQLKAMDNDSLPLLGESLIPIEKINLNK